jgi:thiamine-monophosphate kinase
VIERQRRPVPRLSLGAALVGVASACIDLSDGLVQDAGHVALASEVALHLDGAALPVSRALEAAYPETRARGRAAASGGEDYELLFAAPASRDAAVRRLSGRLGLEITLIGEVRRGRGVHLRGGAAAGLRGFDHLA